MDAETGVAAGSAGDWAMDEGKLPGDSSGPGLGGPALGLGGPAGAVVASSGSADTGCTEDLKQNKYQSTNQCDFVC